MHSHASQQPRSGSVYLSSPSINSLIGRLICVARLGTLGVLSAAPWWYGGVEPDVQFWLYSVLLISLAFWLVAVSLQTMSDAIDGVALPMVLVPVLAALLLGSYQLWPPASSSRLDSQVESSRFDSPAELALLSNISARSLIPQGSVTRSIAPFATRLEHARLVMAVIAVFLGAVLFSSAGSQTWLWTCLALTGAALAFFGIAQQLSWNGKLFGTVELMLGGQPFASYVNRNNAAGYLNLSLAAALGLVYSWLACGRRENAGRMWPERRDTLGGDLMLDVPSSLDGWRLGVLAMVTFIASGIVCSLSRGGTLAMIVATISVCGIMARNLGRMRIMALLLGIGVLSAGLMFWTGLKGRIGNRWEGVTGESLTADARLSNWSAALDAAQDFPIAGTGLGTYRYAYLPYQTWPSAVHFQNADSQFVEGLVEGGLVGLGLMLLAIVLSLRASFALTRAFPADAVGVVGLFAVISQCVSASFDFGPSLAANMLTFAVIIGAVTGRAAQQLQPGACLRWLALPRLKPAWLILLVGVALLGQGAIGLKQVSAAAESRMVRRGLPRRNSAKSMSESSVEHAIQQLQSLVSRQPDDAEAHRELAELWIYRYRLQAAKALAAQNDVKSSDWDLTDLGVLYDRIQTWTREGAGEQITELLELPLVRENLLPAWQHLSAAQKACPWMPEIDIHLAMLNFVRHPGEPAGVDYLRRAVVIAPGDPALMLRCGTLAQSAGRTDFAFECWRRTLELNPERLLKIRPLWMDKVSLDDELRRILPNSPELLLSLAEEHYAGEEHRDGRLTLVRKAEQLLNDTSSPISQSHRIHMLARASVLKNDYSSAKDHYQRLLVFEPLQVVWRMEFVDFLSQHGENEEALKQAELCLGLAPDDIAIRKKVSSLRHVDP